ncbi:ThiF family adenylyltransferase [Mailhella massiliensis]|uniref:ThiF family adenylyltransferase n=1 Tax=Mailhella massiliensis TaxID=1903261 RepID=A0A921AVC1_9BACT|nr:ThiF family adenylyltransferase [Mailhella massiliensis]HJD96586.1 ThiF family adenylyltransferase [Mailhella massiliensis]
MGAFPGRERLLLLLAPFLQYAGDGLVVSSAGIRLLAKEIQLSEREVMISLLRQDIWPLRLVRGKGSFRAEDIARLMSLRILIAGCGGLGGTAAELLARMGAGSLILCDPDAFEESNLNRQSFCTEKTLGRPKVEACRAGLLDIAPYMDIEALAVTLDEQNLPPLLHRVDLVIDCLDSVAKKKMLEKAAWETGIPCVHGAVSRSEGFALFDRDIPLPCALLYQGREEQTLEHTPMDAHALTVTGTSCLMLSLLMRRIRGKKNGDGQLFHFDISIPELETFTFKSGPATRDSSF